MKQVFSNFSFNLFCIDTNEFMTKDRKVNFGGESSTVADKIYKSATEADFSDS